MVRLKELGDEDFVTVYYEFQFLMVRLKEKCRMSKSRRFKISIPYGAIKRNIMNAEIENQLKFQFLMVRLKVSVPSISVRVTDNFNSLWCD